MLLQPLFWLFLPCQFFIFIFVINRISFHPRKVIPEALWVVGGTFLILGIQSLLILGLALTWDFRPESFMDLPFLWKLYAGGTVFWVLFMAANHLEWYWFRKQPVDARMTLQYFPNHPPRF